MCHIVVTSAANTPVEDQFVSWLLMSTVSIKARLLCCLCLCFAFPFLYWIAQQASSLCVWLIPLAHTPSPSAAVRWKGEGTAIDHFFPHTCTHTPHLQRHYRSTCLMFLWGIAGISFCVILHLLPTICWHYNKSQSRNMKKWKVKLNPYNYSNNLRVLSLRDLFVAVAVRKYICLSKICLERTYILLCQCFYIDTTELTATWLTVKMLWQNSCQIFEMSFIDKIFSHPIPYINGFDFCHIKFLNSVVNHRPYFLRWNRKFIKTKCTGNKVDQRYCLESIHWMLSCTAQIFLMVVAVSMTHYCTSLFNLTWKEWQQKVLSTFQSQITHLHVHWYFFFNRLLLIYIF